jgi:hypothetical protein
MDRFHAVVRIIMLDMSDVFALANPREPVFFSSVPPLDFACRKPNDL